MRAGERIKDFRLKQGLTQVRFAKKIGYSHGFLAEIELGKKEPSREFLKKLHEIFGVPTDYLLYGGVSYSWSNILKKLSDAGLDQKFIDGIQADFIRAAMSSAQDEYFNLRRAYERDKEAGRVGLAESGVIEKVSSLLDKAKEVLKSDSIYRQALAVNINAFFRAIQSEKELQSMRDRIDHLEKEDKTKGARLAALEKLIETHDQVPTSSAE